MLERDGRYYTTGYKEDDPGRSPFYQNTLKFDGEEGDYNVSLIDAFNSFLQKEGMFEGCRLSYDENSGSVPSKILIINASHDDLPTSHETARVAGELCAGKGISASVKVVDTRDDLMDEVGDEPGKVLILSQCVDKKVYNIALAEVLEGMGAVVVPGRITAPGSVFSDKDSSYRLLSDNGRVWDEVARYIKIPVEGKSVEETVEDMIGAIDELAETIGDDVFFVKPHEGGGGLGGFRITKREKGYIIPDLSKVSGDISRVHPTFIDIDTENTARMMEILWIYRLFASDEKIRASYLAVDLPVIDVPDEEGIKVLKEYLRDCEEKREKKLSSLLMSRDEVKRKLTEAITVFEEKFKRRYVPLVNEHIDFGFWGLRAHYRLSRKGPKLETMYSRIFQLGFTEEGIGYLGSDNISNKQTGELEILRLRPVNKVMVGSIGGENVLFDTLLKGAKALVALAGLLDEEEKNRIPLRIQLDLATLSQRIGEGNADTARGLCLASRWSEFVRNNLEWIEDSLAYYAWKKR